MTEMLEIPADAEQHLLSSFVFVQPGVRSRLVPNAYTEGAEIFRCPSCSEIQRMPQHGATDQCANCSLLWRAYGNVLHIWRYGR